MSSALLECLDVGKPIIDALDFTFDLQLLERAEGLNASVKSLDSAR